MIDVELSATYSIAGDLDAAIDHGLAAVAQATSLGQDQVVASAYALLASSYVERGQRDLAADACVRGRRAAPGDATVEALLLLVHDGLIALLDEARPAALAAFDRGMTLLRGLPASPPASSRGLWPLLLAVERVPSAASAIDEVQASGVCVNRLNLGYLQLARAVLAGRHDAAGAAAALAADGDRHLVHGPFWHQLGRRLVIEAAVADGWGEPVEWAEEAAAWFATRPPSAIGAACSRFAQPPRGPSPAQWAFAHLGVTRRESDVLALVREGLANKEIAARLSLSPRTVEKHVEALLRKTSSRSRTQLATLAAQRIGENT